MTFREALAHMLVTAICCSALLCACGSDSADDSNTTEDAGSAANDDSSTSHDANSDLDGSHDALALTDTSPEPGSDAADADVVDADIEDAASADDAALEDAAADSGTDGGSDASTCIPSNGGVEQCDDIDNDCNGRIDDGLDLYQECLSGLSCMSGRTTCSGSGQSTCADGFMCSSSNLCVASCTAGSGLCLGIGVKACASNPTQPLTCSATAAPANARDEACNAVDDDCDGLVDEASTGAPVQCFDAAGLNPHTCDGVHDLMVRVQANSCNCDPTSPTTNGCPNGYTCGRVTDASGAILTGDYCVAAPPKFQSCTASNQCTGTTTTNRCDATSGSGNACTCDSEASPAKGCPTGYLCGAPPGQTQKFCYAASANSEPCSASVQCSGTNTTNRCVSLGSAFYVDEYEASRTSATAASAGVDETDVSLRRACSTALRLPWTSVSEADASDACGRVLDSGGVPMHVCAEFEWQAACVGKTWVAKDQWSEFTTPAVWDAVCNADVSSGGAIDTTRANTSCATDWSGTTGNTAQTEVFDLTGNVAEWTSTSVVSGATTSYRQRVATSRPHARMQRVKRVLRWVLRERRMPTLVSDVAHGTRREIIEPHAEPWLLRASP